MMALAPTDDRPRTATRVVRQAIVDRVTLGIPGGYTFLDVQVRRTMVLALLDRPATAAVVVKWLCARCGRHLGDIRGAVLDEPNGNRSNLPCIRRCTRCGRRNVRLQ